METDITFCEIESIKVKQLEVWKRLQQFIIDIKNSISNAEILGKLDIIPNEILNKILLLSNHTQIHNLWISTFHDLAQFSFMMKPGCSLDEIIAFESKCKKLLNPDSDTNIDIQYELPDDMRMSLMICNSIQIPPPSPDPSGYENLIAPLNEWCRNGIVSDYIHENPHSWEESEILKLYFDTEDKYTFVLGEYSGNDFNNYGSCNAYFWNAKLNKFLYIDATDNNEPSECVYDSFQELISCSDAYDITEGAFSAIKRPETIISVEELTPMILSGFQLPYDINEDFQKVVATGIINKMKQEELVKIESKGNKRTLDGVDDDYNHKRKKMKF